jgi:hypothetical protein
MPHFGAANLAVGADRASACCGGRISSRIVRERSQSLSLASSIRLRFVIPSP